MFFLRGDGVKRRILFVIALIAALCVPAQAEQIKWVDFGVPYESLQYAMNVDIDTFEKEKHISWIEILALSACRTGGKCGLSSVKKAAATNLCPRNRKKITAVNPKFVAVSNMYLFL